MRRIGCSDMAFYHKETRNLRIQVLLKEKVNIEILKAAVRDALYDFKEYAVSLEFKDSTLYYRDNDRDVLICPDDSTERYLGTEDTNGYLFYILYGQDYFTVSFFHGLTDFYGMYGFIKNVLYYYAASFKDGVADIRTPEVPQDDEERYDPYTKFKDADAKQWLYTDDSEIFKIPMEKIDSGEHSQHEYLIHISTRKFIELTHQWETTFIPALVSITSDMISEMYGAKDEAVVVKVPADMRGIFDSKTRVNFSDALVLSTTKEIRKCSMKEQCHRLRNMMDEQLTRDNLKKLMAGGVKLPELTYALTYPGKMDLPEDYDFLVEDFKLKAFVPVDSIRLSVKTTKDDMTISMAQAFDSPEIAQKLVETLKGYGFDPVLEDLGRFGGDRYSIERIKETKA